jgi:hypothetical protein
MYRRKRSYRSSQMAYAKRDAERIWKRALVGDTNAISRIIEACDGPVKTYEEMHKEQVGDV